MKFGDKKVKHYPLKVIGGTLLFAYLATFSLIIFDIIDGPDSNVWTVLFPLGSASVLLGAWIVTAIISVIIVFAWRTDYRSKRAIVVLFSCFALACLVSLTISVVDGGGINHSPLASFYSVAIAIAIMSTSEPKFVIWFSILTLICAIIAMPNSHSRDVMVLDSTTHDILYVAGYILALVIGTIAGVLRLQEGNDDEKESSPIKE